MKFSKVSNAMKMVLYGTSKLLSFVVVVILAVFLTFAPLAFLQWAMEQHWAWGFPVVAFYCVVIYAGAREFRAGHLNAWQGIQTIASGLLLTILVFAFLSFVLNRFGAAHYQGFTRQSLDEKMSVTFNFINFYLWQLFELIPGVNINEAFGWKSPLEKFGFVAGLLLIVFRVVIVVVFLKGFQDWWAKRSADSSLETNKALVRRWFDEVWSKGRAEAIDQMLAAEGIAHGLSDDEGKSLRGPGDFKPFQQAFRGPLSDVKVVVEDMISEGNLVAARCSVRGKHTGDHPGIAASNMQVQFTGMSFLRIKEGKIVEGWNSFDFYEDE